MGKSFQKKEFIPKMPFVKRTKTNAYFKGFQTQFRRRREAKTDYYARKRMVTQDLNKYGAPKFRLVARITNAKVIAQIVYSMQKGDFCVTQATSERKAQRRVSTLLKFIKIEFSDASSTNIWINLKTRVRMTSTNNSQNGTNVSRTPR